MALQTLQNNADHLLSRYCGRHWRRTFTLIALLLAGLLVRLIRLNAALWYDEAFSAWLAKLPLQALVTATFGDVHPPAYYLLIKGLGGLLGYSEAVLRAPSVLAGVVLIAVVYRLGRVLRLSDTAVWISTGLTAFAPFQVYYSQEARFYALQMLAITLAALGLVERRWWLLAAGSLAALYLHNISALFVAALFLAGLAKATLKPLVITGAVVAVGYIPGALWALLQAQMIGQGFWVLPITSPGRLLDMLADLIFYIPGNPYIIVDAILSALGLLLVVLAWRKLPRLPAAFVAVSLGIVIIVSALWQPVLISRTMAPIAPFYYILLGASLCTRRRLLAWAPAMAVIIALILGGSAIGKIGRENVDWDMLGFYGKYQPGDSIYHSSVGSYIIWEYYFPEREQYLFRQDNKIDQALTTITKNAMGIKQATPQEMYCCCPRWWLVTYNTPVSSAEEIEAVRNLSARSAEVATFRKDIISESKLYLVEKTADMIGGCSVNRREQ